jgi:hypothetical protein
MHTEADLEAFGRRIRVDIAKPSWAKVRRGQIETLFIKGTEHLRAMVFHGRGGVGLDSAYQFARDKTAEEQDKATISDVRGYGERVREASKAKQDPTQPTRTERRARLEAWQRQQTEAAINAAMRRAGTPKVTAEEFGVPPPEWADVQYPGREPGVTYAHVHREEHGPIWHNIEKRRRQTLALKLKELAADLEKAVADFDILDEDQQASVRKRWRIATERIRSKLDLSEQVEVSPLEQSAMDLGIEFDPERNSMSYD